MINKSVKSVKSVTGIIEGSKKCSSRRTKDKK